MKKLLLACLVLTSVSVLGQIETDRPDFTESPNVVPKGALQVETGFVLQNDKESVVAGSMEGYRKLRTTTFNTTLLRYGITDKLEARLNWNAEEIKVTEFSHPLINPAPSMFDPVNGVGPIFIGLKANLYQSEKVSIGMLSHLYLPWAATTNNKASFVAPEFLIPCSIDITDRIGIAFQYGLTWDGETPNPITSYTFALGIGLTDQLSFYFEPYGFLTNSGDELHLINGGFTYLVNDNLQLDLTGGVGLNEIAPDNFVNAGVSFLILNDK
mgnify:CR=1 FL=1